MKRRIFRVICILAVSIGLLGASVEPPAHAATSSPTKVHLAKRKPAKKAIKKKTTKKKASKKKTRKVCRRVKRRKVCKVVPVLPPTPEQAIAVAAAPVVQAAPAPAPVPPPAPPAPPPPPPPPPPPSAPATPARACPGISISAGSDIQAALTANTEGTSFCLKAGIHRLGTSLKPKNAQKIYGEKDAVLSGARLVSGGDPKPEGAFWVLSGQTQQLPAFSMPPGYGACRPRGHHSPSYSGCIYPDQLFLDDAALWQETSLSEVSAGEFFFDYQADKIYLGDNPSGRRLEISTYAGGAFSGSANNVTVSGLVTEKFANPIQSGVIGGAGNGGWQILNNEVRLNNGIGIFSGPSSRVAGNTVHHNGEMGLAGQGSDIVVEDNEISFNNTNEVNWAWEGGGSKWVKTTGLIVRSNRSHDNYGPGLWTDGSNMSTVYENNVIENNFTQGIIHEISYDAIIRNNTVRGNGFGHPAAGSYWGGGIEVWQSSNVEVHNNLVEDNAHGIMIMMTPRGSGLHGLHETRNVNVHHNSVRLANPTGRSGLAVYGGSGPEYYTSKSVVFQNNNYSLKDPQGGMNFLWSGGYTHSPGWKTHGNDVAGAFSKT